MVNFRSSMKCTKLIESNIKKNTSAWDLITFATVIDLTLYVIFTSAGTLSLLFVSCRSPVLVADLQFIWSVRPYLWITTQGPNSILALLSSMPPTFGYFRSFTSVRGRHAVWVHGTKGGARRTVGFGRLVGSSVGWLARYAACNDWVHCGQVEAAFKWGKSKEPGSEDISEKE
jgi:hypothetical protein